MDFRTRKLARIIHDAIRHTTDSQVLGRIQSQRKAGFGWRYDGLGDWSTQAIFDKLSELGMDTDASRFEEQARAAGSCTALHISWGPVREGHVEFENDFPLLASEELWRRLTPDLRCPELLADRLDARLVSGNNDAPIHTADELDDAAAVVDYLEAFPVEQRQLKFAELRDCGMGNYTEWLLDLILAYGADRPDEVTRIADVMSTVEEACSYQNDLAVALVLAGRHDEARARVRESLECRPDDPWARIGAGDVYDELDETDAAIEAYLAAFPLIQDHYDWDAIEERLQPLLKELGRGDEWPEIERKHPRPVGPPANSVPDPSPDDDSIGTLIDDPAFGPRLVSTSRPTPSSTLPPRTKVGRNDPCPCGSGRKYKKCCWS